jgi:glutamyl-Q tRNA(Asp) synthetase
LTLLTGRFAPSPSGPLHFGSLVAALASYCEVKSRQGNWLLRIEDVDTARVVAGAGEQILRDLEAFGFEWDAAVTYQSTQFEQYQHYLDKLLDQGDCYACECSRRSLRQLGVASGPLGQIYPGLCRSKQLAVTNHSLRLNTENAQSVGFIDRVYGELTLNLPASVGDFVLKRRDNIFAYHLAVVVDDELQGINQVVRGADLLENTCLHIYLQQRLSFSTPEYMHLPLVNNDEGVKLSKQTGASAIDHQHASRLLITALRHLGQTPQQDLAQNSPQEILQWAVTNWNPAQIPVQQPAAAESLQD